MLGNSDYATIDQVSQYYEVPKATMESVKNRNKEELLNNGMRLFSSKEIKSLNIQDECFKIPNRGLILFSKRVILNIGMLLTESKVAEEDYWILNMIQIMLFKTMDKH